jgi:signal transduction histidine kinase
MIESREELNALLDAVCQATLKISQVEDLPTTLQQIVDTARALISAKYAVLATFEGENRPPNFIFSGVDQYTADAIGHPPEGIGLLGTISQKQKSFRLDQLSNHPDFSGFPAGHPEMDSFLGMPIELDGLIYGRIYLANKTDRHHFSSTDEQILQIFAAHAAVAIQNARLHGQVGRLAIVEERTRLGMDLHDGIIQSIYAVGLMLESTKLSLHDNPEDADNLLTQAIEGLNGTIRDIRNFILDLRPYNFQGDLEKGLARLVREFQANTMVAVSFSAPSETLSSLPASVASALFLTTQEALANIARHAYAEQVIITIEDQEQERCVALQIEDDGRGFDMASKDYSIGHGLSNMRARAEDINGSFKIESKLGEGTSVKLIFPYY